MNPLKDLFPRILIHSVIFILASLLIIFGRIPFVLPFFGIAVATVGALALYEFYGFIRVKGIFPSYLLGMLFTLLYIFSTFFPSPLPEIVIGLALFAFFADGAVRRRSEPLQLIATSLLGLIYIAVPLGFMVRIFTFFQGFEGSFWLAFLILVTKSADMGGYFVGRIVGKRKLSLRLSPNKTLEGAVGGVILSMLTALLVLFIGKKLPFFEVEVSYLTALLLGALLGILGVMGDLAESLLKRDVKLKDSGSLPILGGVLDVVDSLLFTSPVMYLFLKIYYNV